MAEAARGPGDAGGDGYADHGCAGVVDEHSGALATEPTRYVAPAAGLFDGVVNVDPVRCCASLAVARTVTSRAAVS